MTWDEAFQRQMGREEKLSNAEQDIKEILDSPAAMSLLTVTLRRLRQDWASPDREISHDSMIMAALMLVMRISYEAGQEAGKETYSMPTTVQ